MGRSRLLDSLPFSLWPGFYDAGDPFIEMIDEPFVISYRFSDFTNRFFHAVDLTPLSCRSAQPEKPKFRPATAELLHECPDRERLSIRS